MFDVELGVLFFEIVDFHFELVLESLAFGVCHESLKNEYALAVNGALEKVALVVEVEERGVFLVAIQMRLS